MSFLTTNGERIVTVTASGGEDGAPDLVERRMPLSRALAIWPRYADFKLVTECKGPRGPVPSIFGTDLYHL